MFDEKKAKKLVKVITGLENKPGVDLMIELKEDDMKAVVSKYGRKILTTQFNMEKISERTMDEVSYATFKWLF